MFWGSVSVGRGVPQDLHVRQAPTTISGGGSGFGLPPRLALPHDEASILRRAHGVDDSLGVDPSEAPQLIEDLASRRVGEDAGMLSGNE